MLHRPNAAARRSAGCIGSCLAGFALYLVLCVSSLAQSAHVRQAQVRHVVDGDTLVLDSGETVRLAGINTPELGQNGQPDQPLAAASTRALRGLIGAGTVVLEEATEEMDANGDNRIAFDEFEPWWRKSEQWTSRARRMGLTSVCQDTGSGALLSPRRSPPQGPAPPLRRSRNSASPAADSFVSFQSGDLNLRMCHS